MGTNEKLHQKFRVYVRGNWTAILRQENIPTRKKKGGTVMTDYKQLYYFLFNAVSDAVAQLERHEYSLAVATLDHAQREAEDRFMKMDDLE